ncbi:CheR family methyltransferase [Treponema sp.]|uniref:CheR family methyltransferase n=1 Tax=Treponema sp. TaxID=166 RepID=UPI00388E1C95
MANEPFTPEEKKVFLASQPELSKAQFDAIAEFIQSNVGIKMPEQKQIMVQSRLLSRLKALKMSNFDDYIAYVFAGGPQSDEEIALMINVITTNLTNFFREKQHFEYMTEKALPELAELGYKDVNIWSAGCSSGEEPYTLSIVMQEFMRTKPNTISGYSVLATDISSNVLGKAMNAVYPMESVADLSMELKKRYFLKSKDKENPLVRVKPELRSKVEFQRLNFMDSSYPIKGEKQIIFCRNVLIYFDKPTQEAVIRKLISHLVPGGYLFLGHSETIFGMDLPLKTVAPTSFKKI